MVTVVRTRNSYSLEWQRKHKFTRQWLFEGLTEPMGLGEEIPAEAQGWGWSRYRLWLAQATITLLKHIFTSLCQVLKRLYALLIELYHSSHGHTWLEMSREFPRHLQFKLGFPPADRQLLNSWWEEIGRTWIWNEVVYLSYRRPVRLSYKQNFSEKLVVLRCLQKKIHMLYPPFPNAQHVPKLFPICTSEKGKWIWRTGLCQAQIFSCLNTSKSVYQRCREGGILMESFILLLQETMHHYPGVRIKHL